ncbi:hypothetical protein CH06BL_38060 [Chromobacterium haemolyticum]|nr:hypothetical protein CH06BL_38060 [Chromobacterium haemolyticum]
MVGQALSPNGERKIERQNSIAHMRVQLRLRDQLAADGNLPDAPASRTILLVPYIESEKNDAHQFTF